MDDPRREQSGANDPQGPDPTEDEQPQDDPNETGEPEPETEPADAG